MAEKERKYRPATHKKKISQQDMASEQSRMFFSFAVGKSATLTAKKSKMQSWENFGLSKIPIAGKPTRSSGKQSSVSAAKNLNLLDLSKTKLMPYYSTMGGTSLEDGDSISKMNPKPSQNHTIGHTGGTFGR